MFDHPKFDTYDFEQIPLNRDLYLMDEIWMDEYEKSFVTFFDGGKYENIGYISYAAARSISPFAVELSWYPNIHTRFHEVLVSLPRDQFVACVGSWLCDEKPHIFVKTAWLENLHLRSYSVFALIDAIDVKKALESGALTRDKLIQLRGRIDAIAAKYPDISFISFADSLLLKSNWRVGQFDKKIKYNYEPEIFIQVILEIQAEYHDVMGLGVYAVITQGGNAYYEDTLLHISDTKNHVSLNSLGLPFAQLMSIEKAARKAIKEEVHKPSEVYMDEKYFHSLKFDYKFEKETCGSNEYREPLMGGKGCYYYSDFRKILENLRGE